MSGHEVEEGGAGGSREPFTGRPLPLHSKKMTGPLLQRLGRGLEVPDRAPPDELQQAIPDSRSGHYGAAKDYPGEQVCAGLPKLSD